MGLATAKRAEALEVAGRMEEASVAREKARETFERLGARPQLVRLRSPEAHSPTISQANPYSASPTSVDVRPQG